MNFFFAGTDSRVGFGFRLGEHADFQVMYELGPQIYTQKIGEASSNERRRFADPERKVLSIHFGNVQNKIKIYLLKNFFT